MSSLREALKSVKSNIRVMPAAPKKPVPTRQASKPKAEVIPIRPKQYISGHEVRWTDYEGNSGKVPFISHQEDEVGFYIAYPSKREDIKLPEGTVRASYNFAKKQVEYFKKGSNEPIRFVRNARHEPLPVPSYFGELEKIEEVFDINLETGEITEEIRVDVLPEGVHWKLRLQEFENQQIKAGVSAKAITFRLQRYLKNLEAMRGVTVEMIAQPIPEAIVTAIQYAEQKRLQMASGA
jgi:hypothetical protein